MTAAERMTAGAAKLDELNEKTAGVQSAWRDAIAAGDDKAVSQHEALLDELERTTARAAVALEVLTQEAEREAAEAARAAAMSHAASASEYTGKLKQEMASITADLQALAERAAALIAVGGLVDQRHDHAMHASAAGVAYERISPAPDALVPAVGDLSRYWAQINYRLGYY